MARSDADEIGGGRGEGATRSRDQPELQQEDDGSGSLEHVDQKGYRPHETPFQAIGVEGQGIKRGLKDKTTSLLYKARPRLLPTDLHKIVTTTAKTPYFSTASLLQCAPAEDMQLLRHIRQVNREAEASKSWQSCLAGVKGTRLLVRDRTTEELAWFLSLGTTGGSTLLVLPVVEKRHMGRKFYTLPSKIEKYTFMPVLDWNEIDALDCQVISPLGVRCLVGDWLQEMGIFALFPSSGEPTTLLKAATLRGFWGMPKTGLGSVARRLGLAVPNNSAALDILEIIVRHVFPEGDDDIMLGILRARVDNDDEGQEHLKEECVLEQLEKKDLDRLEKDEDKAEERTESKKRIRKIIDRQTKARTQVAAAQASGSSKKQPRKKAKTSDGNNVDGKLRKYPDRLELPARLTGENLRTLLPQGCSITRDIWSQAWRLQAFGRNSSKAWHTYTPEGAAEILIRSAWQRAIDLGYEQTCPFKDLNF